MFLSLANLFGATPNLQNQALLVNALQLSRWLDEVWAAGGRIPPILTNTNSPPFLGSAAAVTNHQLPAALLGTRASGIDTRDPEAFSGTAGPTTDATGLPLLWIMIRRRTLKKP